jgi:hypothetical protein
MRNIQTVKEYIKECIKEKIKEKEKNVFAPVLTHLHKHLVL